MPKPTKNKIMFRNQYDSDNSTWSPQGRLYQTEYALEAVKQGSAVLGLTSATHAVLRSPGELAQAQRKILSIDSHVGLAFAGLTSDARVLSNFMRSEAIKSRMLMNRHIPISRLVGLVADKAQVNTQQYGRRPYGVGLVVAGVDESGVHLFECSPAGTALEYTAIAVGARAQSARTFLESNVEGLKECTLDELVVKGLIGLRDTLSQDKELSVVNLSVGVVGKGVDFYTVDKDGLGRYLDLLNAASPPPPPSTTTTVPPVETSEVVAPMDTD